MKKELSNNKIYFARKSNDVKIPTKREEDAGFDIYANFSKDYIVINPHETKMIPTGLYSAFSSDYVAILKERSSSGTKGIGQRCGVIDSGFRGEWQVPITNHNDFHIIIAKHNLTFKEIAFALTGDSEITKKHILYPYEKAICQAIMVEVPKLKTEEIPLEELLSYESERGTGMLGSSNK